MITRVHGGVRAHGGEARRKLTQNIGVEIVLREKLRKFGRLSLPFDRGFGFGRFIFDRGPFRRFIRHMICDNSRRVISFISKFLFAKGHFPTAIMAGFIRLILDRVQASWVFDRGRGGLITGILRLVMDGGEMLAVARRPDEELDYLFKIGEAESLEVRTRHLAIEFVIILAKARERAPGMMRKLPHFISRLFAILMKMLTDAEDDLAWHTAETKEKDAGETSNYGVGQESLDRLAIALGGITIVPVASEHLPAYLSALEWQRHHAALIALAQIAEGCSKVMIKNLEQMVNMVLNISYLEIMGKFTPEQQHAFVQFVIGANNMLVDYSEPPEPGILAKVSFDHGAESLEANKLLSENQTLIGLSIGCVKSSADALKQSPNAKCITNSRDGSVLNPCSRLRLFNNSRSLNDRRMPNDDQMQLDRATNLFHNVVLDGCDAILLGALEHFVFDRGKVVNVILKDKDNFEGPGNVTYIGLVHPLWILFVVWA